MKEPPTLVPEPKTTALAGGAVEITLSPRWLVVRFDGPHQVLSSALVGGGRRRTRTVAWHEVRDAELGPSTDPEVLFVGRLAERRLSGAVGLLTSRSLERYVVRERTHGEVSAQVVATVGLGNALRTGDPPGLDLHVGTINILCRVSQPLSEEAEIEALSVVAEARTLAVLEASVPSVRSRLPSTGTGTDCVVVASPVGRPKVRYAGKHTEIGHVVGASVADAVRLGVSAWLAEQP
jgi:adenosylcobinamide amidohydrolase